ncbi:MAG: hypothetical protein ACI8WB_004263 [Phenylobacterium sp.]|jgi:hypothetical protein
MSKVILQQLPRLPPQRPPQQQAIILNSFVRRTQNTDQLKALMKATGAKLGRKGRSRNWLLQADAEQLRQIIEQIYQQDEPSWLWLAKWLTENQLPTSFADLLQIIKNHPGITVKQLMGLTDCTIVEARAALDEAEFL